MDLVSRKRILQNKEVEFLRIVEDNIGVNVTSLYIDFNVFDDRGLPSAVICAAGMVYVPGLVGNKINV